MQLSAGASVCTCTSVGKRTAPHRTAPHCTDDARDATVSVPGRRGSLSDRTRGAGPAALKLGGNWCTPEPRVDRQTTVDWTAFGIPDRTIEGSRLDGAEGSVVARRKAPPPLAGRPRRRNAQPERTRRRVPPSWAVSGSVARAPPRPSVGAEAEGNPIYPRSPSFFVRECVTHLISHSTDCPVDSGPDH
jgi:hypothetical protein